LLLEFTLLALLFHLVFKALPALKLLWIALGGQPSLIEWVMRTGAVMERVVKMVLGPLGLLGRTLLLLLLLMMLLLLLLLLLLSVLLLLLIALRLLLVLFLLVLLLLVELELFKRRKVLVGVRSVDAA